MAVLHPVLKNRRPRVAEDVIRHEFVQHCFNEGVGVGRDIAVHAKDRAHVTSIGQRCGHGFIARNEHHVTQSMRACGIRNRHVHNRRRNEFGGVQRELHPLRRPNVIGHFDNSRMTQNRRRGLNVMGSSGCRSAHSKPRSVTIGVTLDNAGRVHRRGDFDDGGQCPRLPHHLNNVVARHAVLHSDDESIVGHIRLDQFARPARVIGLDEQQHGVELFAQRGYLAQIQDSRMRNLDAPAFIKLPELDAHAIGRNGAHVVWPLLDPRHGESGVHEVGPDARPVGARTEHGDVEVCGIAHA